MSNTNRTLFQINGMIHPTTDKSCEIAKEVSTQEEADTLMILHAHQLAKAGFIVTIIFARHGRFASLALRRSDELGRHARIIMGTEENRQKILLRPIFDQVLCAHGL